MKFFSLESSKNLVELGCSTSCEYAYFPNEDNKSYLRPLWLGDVNLKLSDAFQPQIDFLADTEQARNNCKILWPEIERINVPCQHMQTPCFVMHFKDVPVWPRKRCEMMQSQDHITFVEESLK